MQQSRADTCKLRYNTSTVLQLSAISRHIEPPGAVLFSTEDMMLQLNQSEGQATNAQTPVKHPKMTKKLLTKETLEKNIAVPPPQQAFSDSIPVAKPIPLPYREEQPSENAVIPVEEPTLPGRVQLQRRPDDITFEQFQQFQKQQQQIQQEQQQQSPVYRYPTDRRRPIKVYDMGQDTDYDTYPNLDSQNKDPLVTRSKYAVNRDVRSQSSIETGDVDESIWNETTSESDASPAMPKRGVHRETLWDIELDKELAESEGGYL